LALTTIIDAASEAVTADPSDAAVARAARTPEELARIARHFSAAPDWPDLVQFSADRRWYRRLGTGAGWEAWLLSWLPGQSTALHDHGPSAGAFTVLTGVLHETLRSVTSGPEPAPEQGDRHGPWSSSGTPSADTTSTWTTHTVPEGQIRAFGAGYVHDVANRTAEPAVSLHVYGPALIWMTRYRLSDDGLLVPITTEQAGADW
jgi:hypothetical protein